MLEIEQGAPGKSKLIGKVNGGGPRHEAPHERGRRSRQPALRRGSPPLALILVVDEAAAVRTAFCSMVLVLALAVGREVRGRRRTAG